ncbi:3-keto-disaccharide hydrolase [Luteolibacter marinus]|uniref:3-keto-disaccharide hydrolase n=1 Tax=Luteolibacter marinus TaxID=2776705 RepID=UPI001867C2EB|nr:DUF1080 domain-containing protein [Luteolibacter marinus]
MKIIAAVAAILTWAAGLCVAADGEEIFNGRNLDGWSAQSEVDWMVRDGAIVATKGKPGLLTTQATYRDYELEIEFRAPDGTNSGVFLSTPQTVTDPATECYELNIAPSSNPYPTGSLVGRVRHDGGEAPEWRRFRVKVESGRVEVWLNGEKVVDYKDLQPLAGGHIGLQFNQGRVEFRKIKIRKLGLP